jgi:3-methyladenine DNA glycosylase AlkD
MPTAATILAELKFKGKEQTRKIYARHGMAADRVYGVSVADMKVIAKAIKKELGKKQAALALELYATGIMDAMYLAGMMVDGAEMTRAQLNEWAEGAVDMQMISESTVPWVAAESPDAREMALKWIASKKEHVAAAGWNTYSGIVATRPDEALEFAEIQSLLDKAVKDMGAAKNRVRHTMNVFVISVGSYVKPMLKQAKVAARQIGAVEVDVGDTACKVPLATAYIEKVEAAARVGKKRKTMRC